MGWERLDPAGVFSARTLHSRRHHRLQKRNCAADVPPAGGGGIEERTPPHTKRCRGFVREKRLMANLSPTLAGDRAVLPPPWCIDRFPPHRRGLLLLVAPA